MTTSLNNRNNWPALDYNGWKDTLNTVHLWTQIVGKVRLLNMPWLNHSWHVTLYISPQGLSTGSVPYSNGVFQLDFDFLHHELRLDTSTGERHIIKLYPRTVASFYNELIDCLNACSIDADIHAAPNELETAIPFGEDEIHKSYDAQKVKDFWQSLISIHNVFLKFRAGFTGKCSPVHFFWGAFDLAVTRFSGRPAPVHQGGAPNMPLRVMQEAYSHEVSSCGFWPGSEQFPQAAFYAYCYPGTPDFGKQTVKPSDAFYSEEMGEFFLPYEAVRASDSPETALLSFLQTTYEAAANTAHWDRKALECDLTNFEK